MPRSARPQRPVTAKAKKVEVVEAKKEEMKEVKEDEYEEEFEKNEAVITEGGEEMSPIVSEPNHKLSKSIDNKDSLPPPGKSFLDEEEMLDVAEHCFIRMAELMLETSRSARLIFTKYSVPEQFPDGTILELMSPIAFLEGCKEVGLDELSEMEAACLLRVLAKPELENAIILNEFVMIMENFGVPDG